MPGAIGNIVKLAAIALAVCFAPVAARATPDPARSMTILLGGDIALPAGPNDAALDALGEGVFSFVRPYIDAADVAFANLEGPFTSHPATVRKAFPMTAPPARLDWVLRAGFDLFSLANNHIADAGRLGLSDTLSALAAARLQRAGNLWWDGLRLPGEPRDGVLFTPPGKSLTVRLLALGNNRAPEVAAIPGTHAAQSRVLSHVARLATESDVTIVSLHGGTEYQHALDQPLADFARALVDAGATVVVCHHAHVVRGIERRGSGLILHGVGNLAFGTMTERHRARGATLWGILPIVAFEDGALASLRVVPLWVDNAYPLELPGIPPFPAAALQPRPLSGAYAEAALAAIDSFSSAIPGAVRLTRSGDEGLVRFTPP